MSVDFDDYVGQDARWVADQEHRRAQAGADGYELYEIVAGLGKVAISATGLWNGEEGKKITLDGEEVKIKPESALAYIAEREGISLKAARQLYDAMDGGTDFNPAKQAAFGALREDTAYKLGRKILTFLQK